MSSQMASRLKMAGCLLALPLAHAVAGPATVESRAGISNTAVIRLSDLPRHYSCEDLQTRLRDVLLALGAGPDMDIRASECERGAMGYSPQVRLQFAPQSQLLGGPARVAQSDPAPRTVRLAPGPLGSWNRGDCELMRQLKDKLLPQLAVKIVAFSLSCLAPAVNSEHYRVIVQAPRPSVSPAKVAAAGTETKPLAR